MHMRHPELLGSAVWADPYDIADRYPYSDGVSFWLGRNPYQFEDMIGVQDDRHVFMCAGTRGGKGRSITLPNLLNWKGSIVSVDPKGENAYVAAPRRAYGNDYCEGLGQDTYVLDPYRCSEVPHELRASCNLMDTLDPDSPSLLSDSLILAEAMRVAQDGGESESWSKEGASITALVTAHVRTTQYLKYESDRNLITVREFLCTGQREAWLRVKAINKKLKAEAEEKNKGRDPAEHEKPELVPEFSPFEMLFMDMQKNPAQGGAIAREATALLDLMRGNVRQYNSLIQNARAETRFLEDLQMVASQTGGDGNGRILDISRLKTDPKGISVFICLPDKPDHPAIRWQKALITLILDRMAGDQREPATGHQVLMSLDEFDAMGKMRRISAGMNSIAGAGVKLFISVTQIGNSKELYGAGWSQLMAGCSIQIWFQVDDLDTRKHLEQACGDAQVELIGRSGSIAQSIQIGETTSEALTDSESLSEAEGKSEGKTDGTSKGVTKGHNMTLTLTDAENFNRTTGRSIADTKGRSSSWQLSSGVQHGRQDSRANGHSSGQSHNDWVLFKPLAKSSNEGRNSQTQRGTNSSVSQNKSQGGGTNKSRTITNNTSDTVGGSKSESVAKGSNESQTDTSHSSVTETLSRTLTKGRSRGRTRTEGTSRTHGKTVTKGYQTTIQKRPLLTVTEINKYLNRVLEREDLAYPGFALVLVSGEDPFLVRKCHYDQDPFFERKFNPHYRYIDEYLPFSQQRLVGGQYTAEHFVPVRLPKAVVDLDDKIDVQLSVGTDQWFEPGDVLFEWTGPTGSANEDRLDLAARPIPTKGLESFPHTPIESMTVNERAGASHVETASVKAPALGKVMDYALGPAFEEDGDILWLRFEKPMDAKDRQAFEWEAFGPLIEYTNEAEITQARLDKAVSTFNAEREAQWTNQQALDAQRAKEEAEAAQREAEEAERLKLAAEQQKAYEERKAKRAREEHLERLRQAAKEERQRKEILKGVGIAAFIFLLIVYAILSN